MGPISGANSSQPIRGPGADPNIPGQQADYVNYLIDFLTNFGSSFANPTQVIHWINQLYNIQENVPFPQSIQQINSIIQEINNQNVPEIQLSPLSSTDTATNAQASFSLFEMYAYQLEESTPPNISQQIQNALLNLEYDTNLTPQENINKLNNIANSITNFSHFTFPQFEGNYA